MKIANTQKNQSRMIRYIALGALLLIVGGFVAYNLYNSRDIETVEQNVSTPAAEPVNEQPVTPDTETPAAPVVRTGSFSSLNGYSVSGTATLTVEGSERRLVLSDDFVSSTGPDVLVYLSKNDTAAEGGALVEPISLGPIQSFSGTQSYVLPENSDEYTSVVIWCRAFSSAFGAASV